MMIAGFSVVITSGRRLFKMLGGEERDALLEGVEEEGDMEDAAVVVVMVAAALLLLDEEKDWEDSSFPSSVTEDEAVDTSELDLDFRLTRLLDCSNFSFSVSLMDESMVIFSKLAPLSLLASPSASIFSLFSPFDTSLVAAAVIVDVGLSLETILVRALSRDCFGSTSLSAPLSFGA